MAKCINCDSKIGFNSVGYYLHGDVCICDTCYDNIKSFSVKQRYATYQEFLDGYKKINDELEELQYTQETVDYINEYLQILGRKVLEKEVIIANNKKSIQITPSDIHTQKVTSGFNFEGYKIVEYIDIVGGEAVLGTGFLSEWDASISDVTGTMSPKFMEKLETAKEYAMLNIKVNALSLGANAIIGITFNYVTFANNMIGVIANGTAVRIEKEEV